jgi:signal transduction histidine kinase
MSIFEAPEFGFRWSASVLTSLVKSAIRRTDRSMHFNPHSPERPSLAAVSTADGQASPEGLGAPLSLLKRAVSGYIEALVCERTRRGYTPYVVLTIGLLLTVATAHYVGITAKAEDSSHFRAFVEQLVQLVIGVGILLSVTLFLSMRAEALARAEAEHRAKSLKASERALREGEMQLRRLHQSESAARHSAAVANRVRDEFLATLSHELRTPLTAMMGWVEMLRRGSLDAAAMARGLEVIERNVKLEAQLIEDLLDVSQIITGKLRFEVRPLDLRPVIEAAIAVVRPAAGARSIRLEVDFAMDEARVLGEPDRLRQVLWNLLSNAIRFTPPGGRVSVRVARAGGEVQITVADDGKGISPEFLPFVFERFRQANSSLTRSSGGLGLGLAIVRHLVELHGGTVSAASPGEGRGAVFTVLLPAVIASDRTSTRPLALSDQVHQSS